MLFSHSVVSDSLWPHGLQHTRLPCPSPSPEVCSNFCHPTISSSVIPFSSCLQSFPESGSFPVSQRFASSSQSFRTSASASVLPMNIQGWFPLKLTGLILLSKGLSRVFSSITIQKHQFFGTHLSLRSNSHIHIWLMEKAKDNLCWQRQKLAKVKGRILHCPLGAETEAMRTEACQLQMQLLVLGSRPHYLLPEPWAT